MTNWFLLISVIVTSLTFTSCSYFSETHEVQPMTERDYAYEKGKAFFDAQEYEKSLPFFLKISRQPPGLKDNHYENSLWNLSVAFEKLGSPEKALLTLQELKKVNRGTISLFKIQLAEMKNHFRVLNDYQAYEVRKEIDATQPLVRYNKQEIYEGLAATTMLNYDYLVLEELEFVAETQKYFVYVMESNQEPVNSQATDLLISIGDRTYELLNKDALNRDFRRKVAESLLDFLRRFDRYKIDDLNLNLKTVSKFSVYSEKKQKLITEWLHQ
ncbi:MAG: hypothetical protein H7328_06815 [Bdellovibrio sp.]|nr:hypothetical protein [Bdellovibrio sp.]